MAPSRTRQSFLSKCRTVPKYMLAHDSSSAHDDDALERYDHHRPSDVARYDTQQSSMADLFAASKSNILNHISQGFDDSIDDDLIFTPIGKRMRTVDLLVIGGESDEEIRAKEIADLDDEEADGRISNLGHFIRQTKTKKCHESTAMTNLSRLHYSLCLYLTAAVIFISAVIFLRFGVGGVHVDGGIDAPPQAFKASNSSSLFVEMNSSDSSAFDPKKQVLGLGVESASTVPRGGQKENELDSLREILLPISGKILFNTSSNQYKALEWLTDQVHTGQPKSVVVETYVLAVLYFATGGSEWTSLKTMLNSSIPICDWHDSDVGIFCEGLNRKRGITQIKLQSNNLIGTIPSELSHLSYLEMLHMPFNGLTGSIPSEIGMLSHLRHFVFRRNALTGTIPSEIGNIGNAVPRSELGQFSLALNKLRGTIPTEIGNIPAGIEYFDLSSNSLNGTIPDEISSISALKDLNLGQNGLTGRIPSVLGQLSELQDLRLEENGLTGYLPSEIGELSPQKFHVLRLDNNEIQGTIPTELKNLLGLTLINLHHNKFTGNLDPLFCESNNTNISVEFKSLSVIRADTGCNDNSYDFLVICSCCCCNCEGRV